MLRALVLLFVLFGCSSKPPAPAPELLPCIRVSTWKEFSRLERLRAKAPDKPLVVRGRRYACIESSLPVESTCYIAKTKKEFDRLSRAQEKRPAWPLKIGKKYYRCLQEIEVRKAPAS